MRVLAGGTACATKLCRVPALVGQAFSLPLELAAAPRPPGNGQTIRRGGAALLRIVLHVEIAREPFASRAVLHVHRCLVGHAAAERDQVVPSSIFR